MQPLLRKILMLIHVVLDVSITMCSLGLYSPGWDFNLDDIWKTFHLSHYSYWETPLDYVLLCLLRQVGLLITIILTRRGKSKKLRSRMWIHYIMGIIGYIVAVLKLLAFDETGTMRSFPGIYMSTVSAVCFSFSLPIAIRYTLLIEETEEVGYERLQSESRDVTNVENVNLVIPSLYSKMMSAAIQVKSFDVLKKACLHFAFVQFSEATCNTIRYICMQYAERLTARNIRVGLFKAILHQDISFFDENKTGQLMSRITHDAESISNSLPTYIETTIRNLFMIFGSAPIMFCCSWQLSISTFITFPITLLVTKYYGLYVEKLSEEENDATAVSNETVEEVVSGIRTVRSFAAEKMEYMRYTRNTDAWFKISTKTVVLGTFYNYFFAAMWTVKDVVVYLYGGYLTLQGRMAPEDLLTYAFYHWRLHAALNEFSSLFSDVMKTIGSSRKVIHIMNRIPELDYEIGTETPEVVGSIVFEDIEFAYPTRRTTNILNGINLSIEPGKTVALVGPSGNGKSTLVGLLQLFYSPQSGRILLDGTPIQNIDHHHYHTKIALVAQEPTLFSGTIRENILYGMEDGTDDDLMKASVMANVHEFVSKMEKGYDTECGEKGVQMSGGQKQRIAIARALIRNPRVLILDEATSALDAESESMVQEALNRCAKERTVIVIAHRLSTVRRADRIAVIEKGNVTEMGNHEDLMKNQNGLYYKMVQKQLGARIVDFF
ncbi:unnamed protein product [Caenorhabditis nigoni]